MRLFQLQTSLFQLVGDFPAIGQDEWIDFRKSVYRFPDGKEIGPFYTYSRRDYVVIVASDTEGNYLCVRQFRQGIQEVTTEFPAGGIERKDGREYGADDSLGKGGPYWSVS